jgi:hypothetical protein
MITMSGILSMIQFELSQGRPRPKQIAVSKSQLRNIVPQSIHCPSEIFGVKLVVDKVIPE